MADTHDKPTPAFTIDVEKYKHLLEHCDATEDEKQELLETLWLLICDIIKCGFEVHPVQMAMEEQQKDHDMITQTTENSVASNQ